MNHRAIGKDRWCFEHRGFAPAKTFRPLPGMKRREVCEACFRKLRPVQFGDMPAEKCPF
jgi:hypothetical protein